jgi:integrase/recombinase XerD
MPGLRSKPKSSKGQSAHRRYLRTIASEVAAHQHSSHTRRAYASTYAAFCDFLSQLDAGNEPTVEAFTAKNLGLYCEYLERQGRSQATLARHLSALRSLAESLGIEEIAQHEIKVERLPTSAPPVLSDSEYEALLDACDTSAPAGARDLSILCLLGDCGLRRSELCSLRVSDIVELSPSSNDFTESVEVGGPEQRRRVPLTAHALQALYAWLDVRPRCPSSHIFVSLAHSAKIPHPLSDRMVGNIVRKYATRADLPEHCCQPYALRHTFCARLARNGVPAEKIAELAGHADTRSAKVYCKPLALSDV